MYSRIAGTLLNYKFFNKLTIYLGLVVVCIFLFVKIKNTLLRQWKIYIQLRWLPGPEKTVPFLGNSYMFFNCNTADIYNVFVKLINKYGRKSAFKFWVGNKVFIILTKPEDLRILYNSQYAMEKEHTLYQMFSEWLGNDSLLIAPVEKWKAHRRILAMTFSQRVLDNFVQIFSKNSVNLSNELQSYADNKEIFNVYNVINKYTVKSICGTLMGVEIKDEHFVQKYLTAVQKEAEIIYLKMCKFWLHFNIIYKFSKMYEDETKYLKILHSFSKMVFMKKNISYSNENSFSSSSKKFGINPKRKPFLELLLDLKRNCIHYDQNQILDDMNIFLAAGTETTSITSSFVLLMLGIHQNIQDKVYEELNRILNDDKNEHEKNKNRMITPDDIRQMFYLEMVIKETLRLYPIVPIVARTITKDLMLPTSGTIPSGCCCIAAPIAVHYDPEIWTQPLLFNPDRFLSEEKIKRHIYSFIPFSGGLRNCIGKKFAFMSLKVLIASIIRDYQILTPLKMEDIQLKVEVTLKSVNVTSTFN
uniref:Cytochrome P450 CYP4415A1 n=1 Tax=Chrysoperla zastrowi sillemi TaxID=482137 RepID=A0A9E7YJB2_9NEOP|nr:cytochrome P450 CYP4415A1 [Chrysoperla zastrowi sillemi]